MRILFVTATYLPTVNGVSYQTSILKKGLENLGHKVFVLAPSFPGYKDADTTVFRYPSIPNPLSKTYPVGFPLISSRNLKKINPDIIHVHHPSIIGQFASLLSETLKIPLFFTTHTQYEKYIHQYFPHGKNITSSILRSDLKNLSKKCNMIICPSVNIQKKIGGMGIKNLVVINNSVEEEFFHKPVKRKYKVPTLVYTGRIDKEKNPMFLIDIAKELKKLLPSFRLLILGDGALLDNLSRRVFKEKLEDNVLIAGDVARQILPSIYKTSHLFITPSVTEVMPLSVIEAMAMGLPTIALKMSGLNEIVIDNTTGYLLPKNEKAIAEKITQLFKNTKTMTKLALGAYNHALNFSINIKSKELEKLYKEAMVSTFGKPGKSKFRGHRERIS